MIDPDILIANGAVYRKVAKSEIIFKEGSQCMFYYQLVTGKISWMNRDTADGKPFIQAIIQPGESFGELPLFDDGPYAASAKAEVDSLVLQLPKAAFLQFLHDHPDYMMRFARLLAQRVREKFFMLREIAGQSPEHRIQSVFQSQIAKQKPLPDGRYMIGMTRQQIANMTGLRVETVIRVIKRMQKSGCLSIERGKVYLSPGDTNHKV